jgi:hypothetical protein
VVLHDSRSLYRSLGRRAGLLRAVQHRALPRPFAPSRRAQRAHMSRIAFISLAIGWAGAVATLTVAALFVRWFA